jgi:hypothetical protein
MNDYFYYADGSGYPYDEFEYDEDDYWYEDEYDECCSEPDCTERALDGCCECGAHLCLMHSEIGCGFCHNCPTADFQGYE